MWQAFVTGFAKQATADIEERNKEIQNTIKQSIINREKENEVARKKAEKEYSTRAEVARKATSLLSGAGLSKEEMENYVVAFVENPERFNDFEEAVKEGRIGKDSVGDFVVLPKQQPEQRVTLEQALDIRARPRAGATPTDFSQTRTAFGLPGERVARAAETEAAVALGMSDEERLGLEFTAPKPQLGAEFKYDALLKENTDTLDRRINKASLALLDAKTPEDRTAAQAELDRVLAVKSLQKQREGGDKESDIRANFRILNNTIMESMAGPGELVRDTETGSLMYSRAARPEVRNRIEQQKRKAFMESELVRSYRLPDGTLPPEVSRVISSFLYAAPAAQEAPPAPAARGTTPAPAAAPTTAPAAPAVAPAVAPAPAAQTASDRQQTIANAKEAVKKINESTTLSRGQKNGRLSLLKQRLREAGIDPKEAGL
jgi:hypothetical protein